MSTPGQVPSFDRLFIGGRWELPSSDEKLHIVSPVTEQVLATIPSVTPDDVDRAVRSARIAFDAGPWPRTPPLERAAVLRRVAAEIRARKGAMADSFSAEIGFPRSSAELWIEGAALMWEDAAGIAEQFEFEDERVVPNGSAVVSYEPVGVVAAITPWNNPVGNASLKIAPALAAGCVVVCKPAIEGPASTLILAQAIEAAGVPEGVVSILPGDREVGKRLVAHADVDMVAFTGSTAAGKRIMAVCSERVARVTLELGGKSVALIADDVDLDDIIPEIVSGGIAHAGQICAALTRVLVPRGLHDDVVARLASVMSSWTVGDPADESTELGPLVAERQRARVEEYIRVGKAEGATLVLGGGRPQHLTTGWYVEPTLFANASNKMRIAQEEIFGPVITVIPFDSIDEAIAIANDSPYGLSGAVYARDLQVAEVVARRVRTGQMWINTWGMSVTVPFGGFKQSGLGREGGVEGFREFLESKYIQRATR